MPWDPANARVTLVDTLDDVLDMRAWLGERRDWLGCDIETTGLNLGRDRIRLCQFGDCVRGWAVPWDDWRGAVKELVPRYSGRIVFHNAAFDLAFLKRDGVYVPQRLVHDTMVMLHLAGAFRVGLKAGASRFVDGSAMMGANALQSAFRAGGWGYDTIPVDHPSYFVYSAMDTMLTAALAEKVYPTVVPEFERVYEVEMGCLFTLRDARLRGMRVDLDYARRTRAALESDIAGLRERCPVNPSKDREVKDLLEGIGRDRLYGGTLSSWWPFRTEHGDVGLDDDALRYFEDRFPDVIPTLREFRKKAKLVNSYLRPILEMEVDGVLRPNIKTLGARTARMSVTEPALQTLPRGRAIRDAFVPRDGCRIVLADYAQMEAREMASYAGCRPMIDAFLRGDDLHTWAASMAYTHGDQSAVQPQQRQIAKNVQYSRMYGAGEERIAATAGVPVEEIKAFVNAFNAQYPEIQSFMDTVVDQVGRRQREEGQGYVVTALGRRLNVDPGENFKGINYLIQGSGGDVLKRKIIELDHAGLAEFIRLPIHDEVFMEVPDDLVDDVLRTTRDVMPETDLFECPLTIDTDVVSTWGEHYEKDPARRGHWVESDGQTAGHWTEREAP